MSGIDTLRSGLSARQNLRSRIAMAVGLFTTVAVLVFGTAVWFLVGSSLRSAVDDDLRFTVELFNSFDFGELNNEERARAEEAITAGSSGRFGIGSESTLGGEGRPPVPYFQRLGRSGDVLGGSEPRGDLPVSAEAKAVARGEQAEHIETIDYEDRRVRLLTVGLDRAEGGGALQIGTDITNTTDGLRRARAGTVLAGLFSGLGAAAMAWLFSRRLVAPVRAVAEAADLLRAQQELPERLQGEGPDELGHLISSFNDLLDDVQESRTKQHRLVADASHELRTPLTSLRLKIEFIQSQPELDDQERQRLVNGAVADLSSLGDLVSELVELASDGATTERPVLIELGELVRGEASRFAATSGREINVSTSPGMIETRPKQIIRALTNLLVNADKYSPADQPITIDQNGPTIRVRDHGPGIPIEDRERVFDRFYRGKSHQSVEGSGLGLAIVEAMAKANGGQSWVTDPEDGGDGSVVAFTAGPSEGPI